MIGVGMLEWRTLLTESRTSIPKRYKWRSYQPQKDFCKWVKL